MLSIQGTQTASNQGGLTGSRQLAAPTRKQRADSSSVLQTHFEVGCIHNAVNGTAVGFNSHLNHRHNLGAGNEGLQAGSDGCGVEGSQEAEPLER